MIYIAKKIGKHGLYLLLLFCLFYGFIYFYDFDTDETIVAVIDSGIYAHHEYFGDKVSEGFNFTTLRQDTNDPRGHGTHVAGIIRRLAPEASLLPVTSINERGTMIVPSFITATYAIIRGADIVNMSYRENYNPLNNIVFWIGRQKGILFVAASGNDGANRLIYPAKYKDVLSVGSINRGKVSSFSNHDKALNYLAPGERITSTAIENKRFREDSGTSMATAYFSGVAASVKQKHPYLKGDALIARINQEAEKYVVDDGRATYFVHVVTGNGTVAMLK